MRLNSIHYLNKTDFFQVSLLYICSACMNSLFVDSQNMKQTKEQGNMNTVFHPMIVLTLYKQ